jgi:integrase
MSQRGSIHRRGATWTVRWRSDSATGRRHHSKGGFRTKAAAQAFLTEVTAAIQSGTFAEPTKITLGEFLIERWLPSRQLSVRPSTYASYRNAIARHVLPELGHLQLQMISADRLDRFYAALVANGLSVKTVRNVHVLIHKALRDAVRKNLVVRNVADAADPPKLQRATRSEMQTWTPDDLRRFFDGISTHRLAAAYVLAATTGMRRGEVLGVRWVDIDFAARRLQVRQTILSVEYEVIVGQPKTRRGERKIALDSETINVLLAHRATQQHERLLLGDGYHDHGLVFTRGDGRPIHPDSFSQTFDRTVRRLGLPRIRLHDLRHTHATLGLSVGIPVKVMSDRLGHATTAFTMDIYMHAIPAVEDDAADQVAGLMFGTTLESPDDPLPSGHTDDPEPPPEDAE